MRPRFCNLLGLCTTDTSTNGQLSRRESPRCCQTYDDCWICPWCDSVLSCGATDVIDGPRRFGTLHAWYGGDGPHHAIVACIFLSRWILGLHAVLAAVVEAMSFASTLVVITGIGSWLIFFPCSYYLGIVVQQGLLGLWWGRYQESYMYICLFSKHNREERFVFDILKRVPMCVSIPCLNLML